MSLAQTDPLAGEIRLDRLFGTAEFSTSIRLIVSMALVSLIPFLLISVTSFLRVVIVLSLVRTAVGTANVPPAPVVIGLSLFLTVFIMTPVWDQINKTAVVPYNQRKITMVKAFDRGIKPLRKFMLRQTRERDLALFVKFSRIKTPKRIEEVPIYTIIPSYMISELKTAFQIGFLLFIPFVVIDLVVANILLSLGMFMLSPVMVSLPFKILLFVLVDGWNLITRGLLMSFG
jgi:flagellar biosynthetic protein FliP